MVDRHLQYYSGEDSTPTIELTDLIIWEEAEFGIRAHRGESTSSSIPFRDEDSITSHGGSIQFQARNVWEFIHGSNVIWRGRIANQSYTRGDQKAGRAREGSAYLEDVNIDWRGIVVHDWPRPAETDVARIQGLIARYLSGSPRATTIINGSNLVENSSNLVTLPAKTYTQTSPDAIMSEIALVADKTYFLLPRRRTTDAHTAELFYDGNDVVFEACPFRITDIPSEIKAAPHRNFPPIWNVGPAAELVAQETLSGLWLFYGPGTNDYVHVSDGSVAEITAHWEEVIFDDSVTTATEAEAKANAIIQFRRSSERRINVTIGPLGDEHIGIIRAGQTITVRAMAVPWADDQDYDARIAELKFTTPLQGVYFAHMQLERPLRMGPLGNGTPIGPQPPSSGAAPIVQSSGNIDTGAQAIIVPDGLSDSMLLVWGAWDDANLPYSATYGGTAMTAVPNSIASANNAGMQAFYLLNPPPDVGGSGAQLQVLDSGAGGTHKGWMVLSGVNQSDPFAAVVTNTGSSTASSLSITESAAALYVNAAFKANGATSSDPVPGAGQTEAWAHNGTSGLGNLEFGGGYGDSTPTWAFSESDPWSAVGMAVNGPAADTTEPVGDTGDPGSSDSGTYAPIDHVHAHGTFASGDYHTEYVREADANWVDLTDGGATTLHSHAGGSGAPTDADYLVGTANGTLSNEIVVGTTPGGELGGTWASPTIDSTHAGSNHNQPVRKNSTGTVFTRRQLNFIEGTNVTLTVADDAGNDEVDITIASSGSGSGIAVEEDGTEEGTGIDRLNFSTNLNVSVSGTEATITADSGGGGGSGRALVDPTGLSWSWLNQGSATITTVGEALVLYGPADASDSHRIRKKAVPSKPYQIIVHAVPSFFNVNNAGVWVGWINGTTNFTGLYQISVGGGLTMNSAKGPVYAFNADYVSTGGHFTYWPWIRLTDDASNRRIYVSQTGLDDSWILLHSVATNDFLTPTDVGFSVNPRNGTWPTSLTVDSWEEI